MAAEAILNKVIETASTISEKVDEIKEDIWGEEQKLIIEEFRESSSQKVKDILNNLNNSSELFDRAGFHLSNLNISLGIPPEISSDFKAIKIITMEERESLISEVADNRIVTLVMKCLFKANDFYDKIKFGTYKLDVVNITLGLTPGINMNFQR
ncbi:MAG: hypothetical protein IPG09_09015 [Ignavibacteria bacterium]|nr:hypothetical protein [Ignavibacteria bacterium]MBK7445825.1 hypothetical protein [Ignavibacteria bacterium]